MVHIAFLNEHSNKIGKGEKSDPKCLLQWAAGKYSRPIISSVVALRCLLRKLQAIVPEKEQAQIKKKRRRM